MSPRPAPAPRRSDRAARRRPSRRRSSGSSRAPAPTRRPRCRRRGSGARFAFSSPARRMSSFQKVLPPSMMVSPGRSSAESSPMAVSVASPAGSITHTARGAAKRLHEIAETRRRRRSLGRERPPRPGIAVVNDAAMPVAHEPPRDVGAHAANPITPICMAFLPVARPGPNIALARLSTPRRYYPLAVTPGRRGPRSPDPRGALVSKFQRNPNVQDLRSGRSATLDATRYVAALRGVADVARCCTACGCCAFRRSK